MCYRWTPAPSTRRIVIMCQMHSTYQGKNSFFNSHWKTTLQYQIEQENASSSSLKDWLSTKVPVVTQSSAGNILWEWRRVRGDTSRIYYCAYSLPCTLVKQCCATKIRDHLKCTTQYLMSVAQYPLSVAQYLLSVVPYILLQNSCLCYVVTCVQFCWLFRYYV